MCGAHPRGREHRWLDGDIAEGGTSTTMCVLANLSLQLKRGLTWDEAKGRVADDKEANQLLARPYRAPWGHPTPDSV